MATLLCSLLLALLALAGCAVLDPFAAQQGRAPKTGKLFFLFMATDHIGHANLWDAFLSDATPGHDYDLLLHCTDEARCRESKHEYPFEIKMIPTMPSEYCWNLITPMVALIDAALTLPTSTRPELDKFVFVSDSTLPAKPFRVIASALASTRNSHFCLESEGIGHPYVTKAGMDGSVAVKTSQWFTTGRRHSQALVKAPKFPGNWNHHNQSMGAKTCDDEIYFFYTIFGFFNSSHCSAREWAESQCPSALENDFPHLTLVCDTFVQWGENVTGPPDRTGGKFMETIAHRQSGIFGPGRIIEMSPRSLRAWRNSSYMFMRKVMGDVTYVVEEGEPDLYHAYRRHVLGNI